jgi:hypothetical protein
MAGTFAHITVVNTLCTTGEVLESIETLTRVMRYSLRKYLNFCELGAVSPDCPQLKLPDLSAAAWSQVMHHGKTADIVRQAVPLVFAMDWRRAATQQCIAWLFGYVGHLVTDMTVHPVLNLKNGTYAEHPRTHRVCEMNQDVYIFHQRGLGEVTKAEYLRECGIGTCSTTGDARKLAPAVARLWTKSLKAVQSAKQTPKPATPKPAKPPEPDEWYHHFVAILDKFVEEGGRLPRFLRGFLESEGLVFPEIENVRREYLRNLPTPLGETLDYDELFERVQANLKRTWRELGLALDLGQPELFTLPNGDLDSGLDEAGQSVFWRNNA